MFSMGLNGIFWDVMNVIDQTWLPGNGEWVYIIKLVMTGGWCKWHHVIPTIPPMTGNVHHTTYKKWVICWSLWRLIIAMWFCYYIIRVSWITRVGLKLKIAEALRLDASIYQSGEQRCSWHWQLRYCMTHVLSCSDPLEKIVFHWRGIFKKSKNQSEPWKYHNNPQSSFLIVVGW